MGKSSSHRNNNAMVENSSLVVDMSPTWSVHFEITSWTRNYEYARVFIRLVDNEGDVRYSMRWTWSRSCFERTSDGLSVVENWIKHMYDKRRGPFFGSF